MVGEGGCILMVDAVRNSRTRRGLGAAQIVAITALSHPKRKEVALVVREGVYEM